MLNNSAAQGPWTSQDSIRHILNNELQLLAALHALEWFASKATRISIRVIMDNVTAAEITEMGKSHGKGTSFFFGAST
jgi:ribonuclease HI